MSPFAGSRQPETPEEQFARLRWEQAKKIVAEKQKRRAERASREAFDKLVSRKVEELLPRELEREHLRRTRDPLRREMERLKLGPARSNFTVAEATDVVNVRLAKADAEHAKHPKLGQQLLRNAKRRHATYIRFGLPPSDGLSVVHKSRIWLEGASVYPATRTPEGHYILDIPTMMLQRDLVWLGFAEDREAYELAGEELEKRGPDGEVVLRNARIVRPIPRNRAVLAAVPSRALEAWNLRRGSLPLAEDGTTLVADQFPFMSVVREVLYRRAAKVPLLHGSAHWKRVAVAALWLCDEEPAADLVVAFCFSLFHDSMREYDAHDPGHAARGAAFAKELRERGAYSLTRQQAKLLNHAIRAHDLGKTTRNITEGVCWDADRLCLHRVGARPNPALLSTRAAKDPEMIEDARALQRQSFSWKSICADYEDLIREREI